MKSNFKDLVIYCLLGLTAYNCFMQTVIINEVVTNRKVALENRQILLKEVSKTP